MGCGISRNQLHHNQTKPDATGNGNVNWESKELDENSLSNHTVAAAATTSTMECVFEEITPEADFVPTDHAQTAEEQQSPEILADDRQDEGNDQNKQTVCGAKVVSVKSRTHGMTLDKVCNELDARISRLLSREEYTDESDKEDAEFVRDSTIFSPKSEDRKSVAEFLKDKEIHKLFRRVWSAHFETDFFQKENKCSAIVMKSIMVAVWNATDRSTELCERTLQINLEVDVFRYLDSEKLHLTEKNSAQKIYLVKGLMGILHNVIQAIPAARAQFRDCSAFDIFQRLRSSKYSMIKCKANILLAHVIEETENEEINAGDKNILFIINVLEDALKNADHRSKKSGFKAVELVIGLNKLAANDSNKLRIVNNGALDSYVKLLQPNCDSEEQSLAAQGIWTLAFKCAEAIKEHPQCVQALRDLVSTSEDEDVKKQAGGALWILDGKDQQPRETAHQKKAAKRSNSEEVRHVMISYQWDYQAIMLKVKEKLQAAGYAVWMDVDYMSGSILEAMALAIENSAVVMIAMSQRYKESPNCRTEAEYTFRQRRDIIPLRVEHKYNPDGWLGALVGNRLFFDLSEEKYFERSIANAIRELGPRGKIPGGEDQVESTAAIEATTQAYTGAIPPAVAKANDVASWDTDKVVKWMEENKLSTHKSSLTDIDGSLLIELKDMLYNAPEFFYSTFSREHNFPLSDLLRLSKALKDI